MRDRHDGTCRRGYTVQWAVGLSAIDFGRCLLASEALADGFDEILWIDSDIGFNPDDIEKLRSHNLPIVSGTYAKKNGKEFSCAFQETGKPLQVHFGTEGGLIEIQYAPFGFILTRREVFEKIALMPDMKPCNQRFGKPITPYFQPVPIQDGDGLWYLPEDYAFCHRARQCGYKIMADTSIPLRHVGSYEYSWLDIQALNGRGSFRDVLICT